MSVNGLRVTSVATLMVLFNACGSGTNTGTRNVSTGMRQLVVQFTVDSPRSLGAEPLVG